MGGRPFLYCSSLAESILRPKFQSHRHHAECQVADCRQHPDCVQRPPDDSRVVPHFAGSQDHAHGGHGNAAEQRNYKSPVPVVEVVDGESCPSPEKASTGTHGVRFQGKCRDHPGNQHGEDSQAVNKSAEKITLIAPPANALLSQVDAPCLLTDSGNKAQ